MYFIIKAMINTTIVGMLQKRINSPSPINEHNLHAR